MQLHLEIVGGAIQVLPDGSPTPEGFDPATDYLVTWDTMGPRILGHIDPATGQPGWPGLRDPLGLQTEVRGRVNAQTGFDPTDPTTYTGANWDLLTAAEKAVAARWVVVPRTGVGDVPILDEVQTVDEQKATLAPLLVRLQASREQRLQAAIAALRVHLANTADFDAVRQAVLELPVGTALPLDGGGLLTSPVYLSAPLLGWDLARVRGSVEDGIEGIYDYLLSRAGTSWDGSGLSAQSYAVLDLTPADCPTLAALLVAILEDGAY